jgi:uncharacterized protein (TIGR03083 family)
VEPTDYVAAVRDQGSKLADVATGVLDIPIPSCPDWAMADLIRHVSRVADFWRQIVDGTIDTPGAFVPADRAADDDLVASYRVILGRLVAALAAADPAAEVWTWAADHHAGFVQRRMAHEFAVHSWDGHHARGLEEPIDPAMAADGIDEYLGTFLPHVPVVDAGDGIHLHATDVDSGGEWLIRAEDGTWAIEHRHAKGAFAARGPASDLLLLLWGRRRPEELQSFGDAEVFRRFAASLARKPDRRSAAAGGNAADRFATAMAAGRVGDVEELLAPDVVFHSPVVHRPYQGSGQLMPVLWAVAAVFEDFAYGETYHADGDGHVLAFSARIGDRHLEGVDIISLDAAGLIGELTVMVRPFSGIAALRDAMAARLTP